MYYNSMDIWRVKIGSAVSSVALFITFKKLLAKHRRVSADTINTFKDGLDKFWSNQDVLYDYK